jgi:uncharacterized protein (TIRG00374 family)
MKINKWIPAGVGVAISLVFLWFAFRNLKPDTVIVYIRGANFAWLSLAAVWYFMGVTIIALRWRFLLRSIQAIPLRGLVPLVTIGYMGNNVYPFRSGEILRIVLLGHNYQVPMAKAMTTVIVERVFDGLVMLTFILVALLFVQVSSPEIHTVASVAAPIFLSAVAVFFLLAARPNLLRMLLHFVSKLVPGALHELLLRTGDEIIDGLEALRSPADLAGTIVASFVCWAVEASVYWMVSFAFNLGVSYPLMLLVVGVVNLAGLIPASPGQIGVFEFFVSLVLIGAGVAEGQAHAFALVVHVVIWLPVTLVGFYFLVRQGLGWNAITHARELEQQSATG